MKLDVTDEIAEVVRTVRHAPAILVDAELENLPVWLAEQVPVSCTGGVVAARVIGFVTGSKPTSANRDSPLDR
jgi:hypothetical protein